MKRRTAIICCIILLAACGSVFSQRVIPADSVPVTGVQRIDATKDPRKAQEEFSPRKATIRSAILPGWGQIYNHKYWKLPIIYGALGTTTVIFLNNINTYKELRFAYSARYKAIPRLGYTPDSTDYFKLSDKYRLYSIESIRQNRDQFRQYIDYSVLFFLFFWGLNVVDASVDAHLRSFDVSPDLSLKIKPGHSTMANTTGLSLVFTIGRNPAK